MRQNRNNIAALPEWWQAELDNIETIVKILTKLALLYEFTELCAFGCLRRHSARASCNCSLNVSGQSRFRHKLRATLPKRINSSSDILRKRVRSCSSSSLDSNAIDMPVSRQRRGG